MIGSVLDGKYQVIAQLGRGAMGEVYLVEHLALGRREALKILRAELAREPEFVSRFRREARATNRVQHPNIVSVYDFGLLADGRFYLAMEHADGESVHALLTRLGRLPVPRALHILHQLADAIDHAHERGVIHRDLKPENMVLIERRGRPDVLKVLDFGIAKIIAPDHTTVGLTRQGEVFGTPHYMSPELIGGELKDRRCDLYAFGCVAFELVTGELPFEGRQMDILHGHLTQTPDAPSARRPEARIPPELDALVARCLAKDPDRRFQTGREVMHALEQVPGYESRPSSGRRRLQGAGRLPSLAEAPPEENTNETLRGVAGAPTVLFDSARELERVVRELTETLVDLGVRDMQLLVGLTSLRQLDNDLRRIEEELEATDARISAREQSAREHDGALRFSLGELQFARQQAAASGERVPGEIERQIRAIEERLARNASELEREVRELTDRSVEHAAARAGIEEKAAAMVRSVAALCAEHVPRYADHPAVRSLQARLDRLQPRRGQEAV